MWFPPSRYKFSQSRILLPDDCNPAAGTCELKTIACSGHALMADGNVFFGGGSWGLVEIDKPLMTPMLHERHALSGNLSNSSSIIKGSGISESLTYNTVSNRWIKNPDSIGVGTATSRPLRWYPTVTRLADSRMMLTGGYENVLPVLEPHNRSVEVFDPVTNTWSITSNFSDIPEGIANPDYTHVYQFPMDYVGGTRYDMVMMLGGTAEPLFLFMNGRQSGWHSSGKLRPGAQLFIDSSAPAKSTPAVALQAQCSQ